MKHTKKNQRKLIFIKCVFLIKTNIKYHHTVLRWTVVVLR